MPNASMHTIAVFNASDDTVEMLKTFLSSQGYRAVNGRADDVKSGEIDFIEFLRTHQPDALVWDIAPPYEMNWNFFQLIRALAPLDRCPIILTTTHAQHLNKLAGQDTGAIEIVGKPYDIQLIVDAVTRSLERRKTTGPRAVGHDRE